AKLARDGDSVENVTVDKKRELHLTALEAVVLEAANQLQRCLERRIPLISLADLLNEVDRWTGCFRSLHPPGERRGARRRTSADVDRRGDGARDEPWPRQTRAFDTVQLSPAGVATNGACCARPLNKRSKNRASCSTFSHDAAAQPVIRGPPRIP